MYTYLLTVWTYIDITVVISMVDISTGSVDITTGSVDMYTVYQGSRTRTRARAT